MEKSTQEHLRRGALAVAAAFTVAVIVGSILSMLEKRGLIGSRRDWAPLATAAAGVCVLVLGWRRDEKGMIASGSILTTMSAVGLSRKLREAKAAAPRAQAKG